MGCDTVFLRKPTIQDLEAMGNDVLTISDNLWQDQLLAVPFDFTGYVGRGALKDKNSGIVFGTPFTVAINANNITGTIAKSAVETIPAHRPFIYDISVDRSSDGDSFTVITGIITFRDYAST
jgi:hypothetical protein